MSTESVRLSDVIINQARRDADTFNRTVGGQIEYWVRLGQAVEAVPGFDMQRVRAALNGRLDAELLSHDERLAFEESLGEALDTPSAKSVQSMNKLRYEGGAVGYDEHGRLVRRLAGGGIEVIEDADKKQTAAQ